MLIIRQSQINAFGTEVRRQFIDAMCRHLREQFHEELWAVDTPTLHQQVDATLQRADGYGLTTERDCCRYLNLAATYGWDFDLQPQYDWMRQILTDTQVSTPSQRLHRLVDQCVYRSEVEESNRSLDASFHSSDDPDADAADEHDPPLILAHKLEHSQQ